MFYHLGKEIRKTSERSGNHPPPSPSLLSLYVRGLICLNEIYLVYKCNGEENLHSAVYSYFEVLKCMDLNSGVFSMFSYGISN